MPIEKVKVHNKKGKVVKYEEYDWFKTVISAFVRLDDKRTSADDVEDTTDLQPFRPENEKGKPEAESLQWYKQSAEFVLERHLRREEAILPTAKPVRTFAVGKGDKVTDEPVFKRADVVACKTAESWHKEGREIKIGEQPMKLVPMRAVTMMRKREMEEVERETGEKAKQGLFSRTQTDWIIPPPIGEDREIPRNAFGNIDVYVPSMVPEGAIHIRLKGTARICRDLGISHAEACTGFEFGKRMAIPVITGVVVAKENKQAVVEAWREREAERQRKEDKKRTEQCLTLWRKFCSGLRIMERMKKEYADTGREEDINPFVRKEKEGRAAAVRDVDGNVAMVEDESALGGGFLREGEDEGAFGEDEVEEKATELDLDGGGFMVEDQEHTSVAEVRPDITDGEAHKPLSLKATHDNLKRFSYDGMSTDGNDNEHGSPPPAVNTNLPASTKKQDKKPTPRRGRPSKQATTPNGIKDESDSDHSDFKTKLSKAQPSRRTPRSTKATPTAKRPAKSNTKTPTTRGSAARKNQPMTKSRYFSTGESDGGGDEEDESSALSDLGNDDDGEEVEVVTPRRTTARTRGRK
ncbi:Rad4-domain-containing protein [Myriangium duriaei CBS 260.36]|uniref:Rad4-domain-containing protein n=1 Tax=Myriangium duriaei CBS 260.36 TaxID=1168546 RepID=A0A9P4J4B3_9PEZI|nr:Rad4-domain-containing protein [Myriangium duriaei CBS 260.36]